MNNGQDIAALVGRVLLAIMFLISGIGKISGYEGTAGYMAQHGLPMISILLPLTILVEIGGSTLLIIGWKARWAAAALFVFTLLAALLFHDFWASPAAQAGMQKIQFMKNITICGGMLMEMAFGAGRYSHDGRA